MICFKVFIGVFSKSASWKLKSWRQQSLNKAVNARLQKNLSPGYIYGSEGTVRWFPIPTNALEQRAEGARCEEGLCCSSTCTTEAVGRAAAGTVLGRLPEGRSGFLASSGFLSFDCRCSYNPTASFGLGKLILREQQQYGCTLQGTGRGRCSPFCSGL